MGVNQPSSHLSGGTTTPDLAPFLDDADVAGKTADGGRPTVCVCRSRHHNDGIYSENIAEYLQSQQIDYYVHTLSPGRTQPELSALLDGAIGILGFNSQLDHCSLGEESFIDAAARRHVPVVQWFLDHPSGVWPGYTDSRNDNCRFLFNSGQAEYYFHRYCLTGRRTGIVTGVGPNSRTRVTDLTRAAFLSRPLNGLLAINLQRLGGSLADTRARIAALEPDLAEAVDEATARAQFDLDTPLEKHLIDEFGGADAAIPRALFHNCFQLLHETVQALRRMKILSVARNFPIRIQSDAAARPILDDGIADLAENVGMAETLDIVPQARAVVSVSPVNDEIHDRTLNGLNAGCVNIIEDNAVHRQFFEHGRNALLFRYGDDSLSECLDLVCNNPQRAWSIAQAGFAMRDAPRLRFGGFRNILDLMNG